MQYLQKLVHKRFQKSYARSVIVVFIILSHQVLVIGTKGRLWTKDGVLFGRKTLNVNEKEKTLEKDDISIPTEINDMCPDEYKEQMPLPLLQVEYIFAIFS